MLPQKTSRGFSFFGVGGGSSRKSDPALPAPSLRLQTDKNVYRPGDPLTITIQIRNPTQSSSLVIERLSFEIKGIEKLDTQWFNTQKPLRDVKQRRGEYVFVDCSAPSVVSNQILSSDSSKTYVIRTILPSIIPPSYRGAAIRYLYYVKSTLSGQYIILENGQRSHGGSIQKFAKMEVRTPLNIWVSQKTNGLVVEDTQSDGIVPPATVQLDVYWKEIDGDSDWARVNETYDGNEEGGYESSRDEVSSVSSYNASKESVHKIFGSSLSLQSFAGRFSNKDATSPYLDERASMPSYVPPPRLSVAEVSYDSGGDVTSQQKSPAVLSPSQQLKHTKSFSADDESKAQSPLTSEDFVRGRSYNIRLDDQVLLRFSPKNSDSNYYFSDMIGGTLTFFREEQARKCLELSITLEMSETISGRSVHHSRRHSPTITKVHSDHHEVVADLVQTSFLFSIPTDGPMSFSTRHVSVQWSLRFEFYTTPKNLDWTRYEHPLMIEGRDKCDWVLPITVHAPPQGNSARNNMSLSLEPLWATRT